MAGDLKKDVELEEKDEDLELKKGAGKKSDSEEQDDEGEEHVEDKRVNEDAEEAAELEAAENEADRDKIRERRRDERKLKKARRREAEARTKEELSAAHNRIRDLEGRLANLETRGAQGELAQVDAAIKQGQSLLNQARTARLDAQKNGDWEKAEQLDDQIYKARRYIDDMTALKKQAESEGTKGQPANGAMATLANKWITDNSSWYQPKGRDEDSRIARAISDGLVEDGFDPATQRYWDELSKRVAKKLPHVGSGDEDDEAQDDDPPARERSKPRGVGSTGNRSNGGGAPQQGDFHLSKQRREALIEAGVRPGTKEYKEWVDYYKKWDKDQAAEQRGAA